MEKCCETCVWFYDDDRDTVYRRGRCCFCRRKPFPFSRQHRVGEGSRIDPKGLCEHYERKNVSGGNEKETFAYDFKKVD